MLIDRHRRRAEIIFFMKGVFYFFWKASANSQYMLEALLAVNSLAALALFFSESSGSRASVYMSVFRAFSAGDISFQKFSFWNVLQYASRLSRGICSKRVCR